MTCLAVRLHNLLCGTQIALWVRVISVILVGILS